MRQAATASLLAFTAGFVDTAGFIALFGLFTAHVTGNFVLIGASLADFHPGVLAKLLALPVFIAAVAASRLYVLARERQQKDATGGLLIAEIVALVLFLTAGIAASPFLDADAPLTLLTGQIAVIAMAIQNAASRTVFVSLSPTTVMTGNVTVMVIDAVDLLTGRGDVAVVKARFKKMAPPVATFGLGALAGALLYIVAGFWAILAPIASVATIWVMRARGPKAGEAKP
jgi:uncharacterized membrane protein YoaK (UPF0700 family)